MKRAFEIVCLAAVVAALGTSVMADTDTFGTGDNEFTIDFVPISGNASAANGTNISQFSSGVAGYRTFTDPGYDYRIGVLEITNDQWDVLNALTSEIGDQVLRTHRYPRNSAAITIAQAAASAQGTR